VLGKAQDEETHEMGVLRKGVIGLTTVLAGFNLTLTAASADGYTSGSALSQLPSIWYGLYGGLHLGNADGDGGNGLVGGVQLGYNWQAQRIVYGVEGDVSLSGAQSVDWLASLRGRVGYLIQPRVLLYGTAGLGLVNDHGTDAAFVYGLGVEGKLTRTMSARLEYLAYDPDNSHSHSNTVGVIRAGLNFKLDPF
jgi:outer membrane immunogenic protein